MNSRTELTTGLAEIRGEHIGVCCLYFKKLLMGYLMFFETVFGTFLLILFALLQRTRRAWDVPNC